MAIVWSWAGVVDSSWVSKLRNQSMCNGGEPLAVSYFILSKNQAIGGLIFLLLKPSALLHELGGIPVDDFVDEVGVVAAAAHF